jgi:hypothetical protein
MHENTNSISDDREAAKAWRKLHMGKLGDGSIS